MYAQSDFRMAVPHAAVVACTLIFVGTGCDKLKSRDHLNQGVAAFKNAKYARRGGALQAGHRARSDQSQRAAVSGHGVHAAMDSRRRFAGEHPDGAKAKDEFLKVLEQDPNNTTALASLASLAYNQALVAAAR